MSTNSGETNQETEKNFMVSIPEEETTGMLNLTKVEISPGQASNVTPGKSIQGELLNSPIEVGKLIAIGLGKTSAVERIVRLPDGFEIRTRTSTYKLTNTEPNRPQ